ncbi:hypothetical protein CC78DRAFT_294437 [Lojkania enalia]|uniref:Uncharacterized protein n=1 Tax=Lojkania enalia TaxID=147567 RepID=A0A9P4K693_9PLEO|nr:hypothetical protein CC78DRAFT_294437 [Didymosphaeria enalia]
MSPSLRSSLSVIGVVAWSITAAVTVFSILDATSLSTAHISFADLLIASSVFDVLGLCSIILFSIQYAWKNDGVVKKSTLGKRILALSCTLISAVALVLTLVALVTIKKKSIEVSSATLRVGVNNPVDWLTVQFVLWALACFGQIILYSAPLERNPNKGRHSSFPDSAPRDSVMSEVRNSNQMSSLHILEPIQPASPLAALPSPTFSARSSQSLRSWRESLQNVVRPVTSRSRLINRPSFYRDGSIYSEHSIDNLSQSDGFDSWDTSSVDRQTRDAVLQTGPSRGTALEPIPGSRPASPARALDGPFPETDGSESPSLAMPPKLFSPDTSRPPSPAVSEAHIHPLFRAESPVPPPVATPGTSIVASPLSNKMIACPSRPYSRMRSNSRAGSPSPLVHSQSFLRDRAVSPQRSLRSPSPPSREMTPPIPDFVLNSSPRSSFGSNSRRKVNLQLDIGR